jgi:hypothetical protein
MKFFAKKVDECDELGDKEAEEIEQFIKEYDNSV